MKYIQINTLHDNTVCVCVCVCVCVSICYLSMMTGSDGVSFLFPQLFLSQQRLTERQRQNNKTVTASQRTLILNFTEFCRKHGLFYILSGPGVTGLEFVRTRCDWARVCQDQV